MTDELTPEERKWIDDAETMSDRAAAISMTALVEQMLTDIILNRMINISNTFRDELFGDRGPINTFSAKIDIGFALGLYGTETKLLLHALRRIRNRFAHYYEADHFDQVDVLERCKPLPTKDFGGKPIKKTRMRFHFAGILLSIRLNQIFRMGEQTRIASIAKLP